MAVANESEGTSWSGASGQTWAQRHQDLDLLMAGVTDLLMDRAALAAGIRVLDVGCGAGHSTLAAARAAGPEGHVTGLDLSAPLLEVARARAAAESLDHVTFIEADAARDRIDGPPFDAMISRFGTMFFDDPVQAFANIRAQLKPGASVTFVAWAAAHDNPWFALPHRLAEARLGPAPASDPDAPGPTAFRDPARVTALLERGGLREPAGETCDILLHHPGGAAALAGLAIEVGPASRLLRLRGGSGADRAALERDIEAAFGSFALADRIAIPARVIVYRARAA